MKKYSALALIFIVAVIVVLVVMPSPLPPRIGTMDLRPFWSASFLFIRGENFMDHARLFQVQRELTDWQEGYPMLVWNPAWLFLILAPYTFVAFSRAVWLWLLTNLTLIMVGSVLVWQSTSQRQMTQRRFWLAPVIVFASSTTLLALIAGQVNSLVFIGFAGFLFFLNTHRDELAGTSLMLTTVKPQVIYIALPILLLHLIYTRRWRAVFGFGVALLVLAIISFAIRPPWLFEFVSGFGKGPVLDWEMPTLGGLLGAALGWYWAKWMGVIVLPLAVFAWFYWRRKWDWRTLVDLSILIGILTTPFTWSYDQILLMIPLIRVVVWIIEGALDRWTGGLIVLLLIVSDAIAFYERILSPSELYYFWLPMVVAAIYLYALRRVSMKPVYA